MVRFLRLVLAYAVLASGLWVFAGPSLLAGADPPQPICSWSLTDFVPSGSYGVPLSSYGGNLSPFYDEGTTEAVVSCSNLNSLDANQLLYYQYQDGVYELLILEDADSSYGSAPYAPFSSDSMSFDANADVTAADDSVPGAIESVAILQYDTLADLNSDWSTSFTNSGDHSYITSDGTSHEVDGTTPPTTTTTTTTTVPPSTTTPAYVLVASGADDVAPGLLIVGAGIAGLAILLLSIRFVFNFVRSR